MNTFYEGYSFSTNRLYMLAKQGESRINNSGNCEEPIILSVASIEAFINELPYMVDLINKPTPTINILKDINSQRIPILFRIRMLYYIFNLKELDKGSQPYQDIALLFSLRNLILHREVETFKYSLDDNNSSNNLNIVNSFISRGIIKEPNLTSGGWSQYLLVRPVVLFAIETALKTFRWIYGFIPDENCRKVLKFHIQEIG